MNIDLNTNALPSPWVENTETIQIMRRTNTGTNSLGEPTFTTSTVYNGPADFQEETGDWRFVPEGQIPEAVAMCIIDASLGIQPNVLVGDEIVVSSNPNGVYAVMDVSFYDLVPLHAEVLLKRGRAW